MNWRSLAIVLVGASPHLLVDQQVSARVAGVVPSADRLFGQRDPDMSERRVFSLNWTAVDSACNAFSMMSNVVKPLAFDPLSNTVTLVNRHPDGWCMSSPLRYSFSSDGGETWSGAIFLLDNWIPSAARFPSAALSNPPGATTVRLCFSAPHLNPSSWGFVTYGYDDLGANNTFAVEDQDSNNYWTNTRIVAADDSPYTWWLSRTTSGNFHLWRTADYSTIEEFIPWPASTFQSLGQDAGLAYRNGTLYLGVYSTFPGDPDEVHNVAYSASSETDSTWSPFAGPNISVGDWRTLPGIVGSPYMSWEEHLSFDMLVDHNGRVHFFGTVQDTTTGTELALVEIYETDTEWRVHFVTEDLKPSTRTDYGGVDSMGYHVNAAISPDGLVMALAWVDAPSEGDSIPDFWVSWRHINSTGWSPAANITSTPDVAELLLQVAPTLRDNGDGTYTLFLARSYECHDSAYPPTAFTTTCFYVGSTDVLVTSADEQTGDQPESFSLDQNYPNPFNSSTTIRFATGRMGFVRLTVYDILGREVATLVNEMLSPGTHTRTWEAVREPSGVYFYRLSSGGLVQTRKLLLLR